MNTLCYLFIYIFEQFVSYIFFNNKFERKLKPYLLFIYYTFSFLIQFCFNFAKSPIINLLTFCICNMLILTFCFNSNTKSVIFNAILLSGLMLTTEVVIMFAFSAVFNSQLLNYEENTYAMLFQTIATKSFYFFCVYFLSKLKTRKTMINRTGDFSLLFLPIVSIITTIAFYNILIQLNLNSIVYLSFTIVSFVLLFANVFVFLIHERVVSTLTDNIEYQLEIQKAEINYEYYNELERQYELSNLLIHDIKKHLEIIKSYAQNKDYKRIEAYIDSVYDGNEIPIIKKYSNNKLVNVIINRYVNLCNNSNVILSIDIRNIDFSFVSESDLTSLLNNILENSYEAAVASHNKMINLIIDTKNETYIKFYVENSCDTSPNKTGELFSTTKTDKNCHGFGIKCIRKIAKKYHGNAEFQFNKSEKIFTTSVLLKIK